MLLTSKVIMALALSLLFIAYSNFAPSALSSTEIAGYTKNHFVREMIFGVVLAIVTIYLIFKEIDRKQWLLIAFFGSIVVMPFWVAATLGWTTEGMQDVWQGEISTNSAYILHGIQTIFFYIGLAVMYISLPADERS